MKKSERNVFYFAGIILCLLIITLSFYSLALNDRFYTQQFLTLKVHEEVGLSESDIQKVSQQMKAYFSDQSSHLQTIVKIQDSETPFYNAKELEHMKDVKVLFKLLRKLIFALEVALLLSLGFLIMKKSSATGILSLLKSSLISAFVIFVGLITLALVDFEAAFIKFHHLFFTNDLWLLDPRTDRLIQIMPLEFFIGFISKWLTLVGLSLLVLLCIFVALKITFKKYSTR